MSVGSYIAALLASEKLGGQVTCHRLLPAAEPQYAQTRLPWPTAISRILEQRGIAGLYSHQALATDHIRAGHSIVAATPTASGKSLIYNLPVLERHLRDPDARALYLFPLKALAQDQLAAFNALTATWPKDARPAAASRWPAVVVPDEEEAEQGADDEEGDGGNRVDAAALAGH